MTPEQERALRVYALEKAIQIEGAKAVTSEVLDCAEDILAFLTGQAAPGATLH